MTYSEFSFPNDLFIFWSLMIVTYPYLSGMVLGAFSVPALHVVFNRTELRPVSRFSLLICYSFLLCLTLPLLNHLGHPERSFNIAIIPNFRSAIGGFGVFYGTFFITLTLIIWFTWRGEIIAHWRISSGLRRKIWRALALGMDDDSPEALAVDRRVVRILMMVGIPTVAVLSGYVGFLFGSLKSNPWWSTPLMPFVFLFSGLMSGLALVLLLYLWLGWKGWLDRSYECLRSLSAYLWWATLLYVIAESVELLYFYYESSDAWFVISTLLFTKLLTSFFLLQVGVGLGVGFVTLTFMFALKIGETTFARLAAVASAFILFEVWMMRWNIVIGGQLFSKSYVGFRGYFPHWLDREGILAALFFTLLPLLVFYLFTRILNIKTAPAAEN